MITGQLMENKYSGVFLKIMSQLTIEKSSGVILKIMSQLTFEKSRKVKMYRITQFLHFHKRGMILKRHSKRDIKSLPGLKVVAEFMKWHDPLKSRPK